jgi:diguanylate cyclase (GGDEF)-like protein
MGKAEGGGASVHTWLLAIFGCVVLAVSVGVPLVTSHQENRAIRQFAQSESERNAQMVFDHLYSVMRKGWTREDIDEILARINSRGDSVFVRLYRSPAVTQEFGPHAESDAVVASDPDVRQVFLDGADRLIDVGGDLRYLYPLVAEADCVECHVTSAVGDVNGVLDVRFSTAEMRVPLRLTLQSASWLYGGGAAFLFVALFIMLRAFIVRPVVDISATMQNILASDDLGRRITVRRAWPREVRMVGNDFNKLMTELDRGREILLTQSERDPLTGLFNRRRFDSALTTESERANRTGRCLSVLLIDLDRFKPINDTYGHAAGDAILKAVASVLEARIRKVDVVARIGGDEFAVLAPETNAVAGHALAAALVAAVDGVELYFDGHKLNVGASIGVAALDPQDAEDVADVMARADEEMYRIKEARHRKAAVA